MTRTLCSSAMVALSLLWACNVNAALISLEPKTGGSGIFDVAVNGSGSYTPPGTTSHTFFDPFGGGFPAQAATDGSESIALSHTINSVGSVATANLITIDSTATAAFPFGLTASPVVPAGSTSVVPFTWAVTSNISHNVQAIQFSLSNPLGGGPIGAGALMAGPTPPGWTASSIVGNAITYTNTTGGNAAPAFPTTFSFTVTVTDTGFALGLGNFNFASQVVVAAVPEPGTVALGLSGLLALGIVGWRRRNRV